MTVQSPGRDTYDVVVVGGGTGGLTAAALTAVAGLDVLVIERGSTAGGYARPRHDGARTIDSTVQLLSDPPLFRALLAHLGVADRCDLIDVDTFYVGVLPDARVRAPVGDLEAFIVSHVEAYPRHEDDIRGFFTTCSEIHRQAHALPQQAGLADLDRLRRDLPLAFEHRKATVGDLLDQLVGDPAVRSLCGLGCLLLGLPPSTLAVQTFAQSVFTHVIDGSFVFRGGVGTFIDALVAAVEQAGGEVVVGQTVAGLTTSDGKVDGVVLEDGRTVRSTAVVSGAAALDTFGRLLPREDRPATVLRKLGRLRPGPSAVVLDTVIGGLEPARSDLAPVVLASGGDVERSFTANLDGVPEVVAIRTPSLVDPTLAPAGEHVASVCAYTASARESDAGFRPGEEASWEQALLAAANAAVPGFAADVRASWLLTPKAFRERAFDAHGAAFGWEETPRATGAARPAPRTPVPGLYLAGKWTQPGGCFLRSTISGVYAGQLVMADAGMPPLDAFAGTMLPALG